MNMNHSAQPVSRNVSMSVKLMDYLDNKDYESHIL